MSQSAHELGAGIQWKFLPVHTGAVILEQAFRWV